MIENILQNYYSENPGVVANLRKILMQGKLGGTGKLLILPVDQGFEHGPERSFFKNSDAYDPMYHFELAIESGLSAYAAPLGMLAVGAYKYAGSIPLILKLNSSSILFPKGNDPDQAFTATVDDALRLGCSGIGITLYPGSVYYKSMLEKAKDIISYAKMRGLVVVIWSYPRGGDITKAGETALDVISYAAHMACLLGGHIIKVKLPSSYVEKKDLSDCYKDVETLSDRVKVIKRSCFNGRRLVVFSGGSSKTDEELLNDISAIKEGGGDGSIIGRNSFQRDKEGAIKLLNSIIGIYQE